MGQDGLGMRIPQSINVQYCACASLEPCVVGTFTFTPRFKCLISNFDKVGGQYPRSQALCVCRLQVAVRNLREFRTASDKHARPGNEVRWSVQV